MRVEVWNQLECAGGGVLGVIPDVSACTETRSVRGLWSLILQLPGDSPAITWLGTSRILRVIQSDTVIDEWVIQDYGKVRGAQGLLLQLSAVWPDSLLNQVLLRQVFADGTVAYDFEQTGLTPTQWIDSVVLPSCVLDGFTWVSRGTVGSSVPQDFQLSSDTARSFLGRLASPETLNLEFQLRRNGGSGYLIDLLAAGGIGSGAQTIDLRLGKNLVGVNQKKTRTGQVTRCSARGTAVDGIYPTIAGARWKVQSTPTGSTAVLVDPLGGDGPIAFDSQLVLPVARYVRKIGGSLLQLTASVASSQQITTASAHGWSTGDFVEFKADSSGTDLTYLEHPTKVLPPTTGYGLLAAQLDRPDLAGTLNLVPSPDLSDYSSSPGTPPNWELVGGMASGSITKVTTGGRWLSGGCSARLNTMAGDGNGIGTVYAAITPSSADPYLSGFIRFWIETTGAQVRAELVLGQATIAISGTPTRATSAGVTTVTVTTSSPHGLLDGAQVEITGATPAGYNGIRTIKVLDTTHFTYTLTADPGSPGGTWVARQVWVFPDQGISYSTVTKAWDSLGIAGIDANALGATVAKIRLVQHGDTSAEVYIDAAQLTPTAGQQPFLAGCGATRLWQIANRKLLVFSDPLESYDVPIVDLNRLDPTTWPYDAVTLGGLASITDAPAGVAATVRVLEVARELTPDKVGDTRVKLATRTDEFTDESFQARRTDRFTNPVDTSIPFGVSGLLLPLTTDPNTVRVTLTPAPPGALVYFWVGQSDQPPPKVGQLTGTTNYSATQWGRYPGPISVTKLTTMDLRVWAYCVSANRVSALGNWQVAKAASITAPLTLTQPGTGSLTVTWAPSSDVERVRIYARRVASGSGVLYPTKSPSGSTDEVDEAFFVAEMNVTVSGGGIDKNGTTIAGGTALVIDQVGTLPNFAIGAAGAWANGDHLAVVAVPFGTNGKAGTRATATIDYATAAAPALLTFGASKTGNGTDCVTGAGGVFSLSWTVNGSVVNATHSLRFSSSYDGSAWTTLTTITTPVTGSPQSVTIDRVITSGKFDPTISVYFKAELIVTSGGALLDSKTTAPQSYQSQCPA